MPKTIDSNQTQKTDRPYIQPIYLVKLLLSGLTLYFSDRNYTFNSVNYEDYLENLEGIENQIRNLGGFDNSLITLIFKNQKITTHNYLIELFDDYPPEKKYLEIYKLMIDTGETFGSDVSTKIFKGEMGQPYEIDELTFKIDCSSMLFGKNVSLPLDVIDLTDYPSADKDDVGKYRNIVYGNVKRILCPWTVAGWASTLVSDIAANNTTITISDATTAPTPSFNAIVDNEWVRVTASSNNNFTVTRAYNSSNNTAHSKGAVIYEARSDFEVEVAQHPVKSVGDVYGRRSGTTEWMRAVSGFTAYNNSSNRAKIVFTDKIKWEQSANYSLSQNNSLGTHPHDANFSGYTSKTCIPTGGNSNCIDGSLSTGEGGNNWSITFSENNNVGTVNKQFVYIAASTGNFNCYIGANTIPFTGAGGSPATYQRFAKVGGNFNDGISITAATTGTIYEVYKDVEYTPVTTVNTHAANGVDFGAVLSGDSVANMIIADQIAADVQGYMDDGSGTYTGTPSALIERPDHVRKHILVALLGFNATNDIDSTSFTSAGNTYASQISGGYKFAFVLHDVATEAIELFQELDYQSRSNLFESQGKFKLVFNSISSPTSQKTFNADNIRGRFLFHKTEVADIRNKIRGHFFRDYSNRGATGEKFQKVYELSNAASITKYGEMIQDIEFSAIGDLQDMVDDVMDAILLESKELKKAIFFEAFWDAMLLDGCDYFTVESNFWNNLVFKTLRILERPMDQIIELEGLEYVAS